MTTLELYLLTRVGNFHDFFMMIGVLSGIPIMICSALFFIVIDACNSGTKQQLVIFKKWAISISSICGISFFLATMTPSNKEIAFIITSKWVTNNEEMKKLPENVLKITNKFLEKYSDGDKK